MATLVVTAACSSGGVGTTAPDHLDEQTSHPSEASSAENAGLSAENALNDTDIVSPLLEFQGGGAVSDEIHNAEARAVSSCMQERGWSFEPPLQRSAVAEPRTIGELREYRATYGYGMFTGVEPGEDGTAAADRNHLFYLSLSSDEQRAYREDLNGDVHANERPADDSCESIGRSANQIPLEDQAVMRELAALYEAAGQSTEFLGAVDSWRQCLSDRGYRLVQGEHPTELIEQQADVGAEATTLAALEIDVAVADFECAAKTTMAVLHRLESQIVQRLVEKYPEWGS